MTDRYAVIGNPVAHSRSPLIHAMFARQTGQDISYEALLAPVDDFAATLHAFMAAGGRGANVTVPFKEQAFELATRRAPRAEGAGAANTLALSGGGISADNTDGAGLVRDLEANLGFGIAGRHILLLGAGGAARGVIGPLLECRPMYLRVANRNADKARALAGLFGIEGGGFNDLAGLDFDLVINATSAGLADAVLPLPAQLFAGGALAYEMFYGRRTAFMNLAAAAGATVADGLGMLVEQAAESFLIWRGVRPETAAVLARLRAE